VTAESKTVDTAKAEELREQLEGELGAAVEATTEAMQTAGKLAAMFAGVEDFTDEHKQAASWQTRLLTLPLADILAQVSGEEDEEEPDEDAPVLLMIERKKVRWLKSLVEFARTIDSADFQTDACDEVLVDLEHAAS
jgi:hypothetical protein